MNKSRFMLTILAAFVFTITFASAAQAVAVRTFVASTGNDTNTATNCGRTTPCRLFSAAYSVTSSGGEIIALDSAGFGGFTITTPVTVAAIPGEYAFINVTGGTAGFIIAAAAANLVVLRNIQIGGAGVANTTGVQHNSGKLVLDGCSFTGLTTGIAVQNAKADVIECDITGNTVGISTTGTGKDTQCPDSSQIPPPTTSVRVERGNLNNNGTGFIMNAPGTRQQWGGGCPCLVVGCPTPPTPTPSPVNDNKITIFLHITDNSTAGATMNITGNTTFMTGTGAGCTATPGLCTQTGTYSGTSNPQ